MRDRIRRVQRVKASELVPNPANWRRHPDAQRDAMTDILEEVGSVDVLKAVETPDGLMLIDGHLRQDLAGDEEVRVAVLDLDDDEQRKVLATFDPIGAMAHHDQVALTALVDSIEVEAVSVRELLTSLTAEGESLPEVEDPDDPEREWTGMPEFEQENLEGVQAIRMHFATFEDAQAFGELIEQNVTEKTRSLWYPKAEPRRFMDKRYVDDDES